MWLLHMFLLVVFLLRALSRSAGVFDFRQNKSLGHAKEFYTSDPSINLVVPPETASSKMRTSSFDVQRVKTASGVAVELPFWGKVVDASRGLTLKKGLGLPLPSMNGGPKLALDGSAFANPRKSNVCLAWLIQMMPPSRDQVVRKQSADTIDDATEGAESVQETVMEDSHADDDVASVSPDVVSAAEVKLMKLRKNFEVTHDVKYVEKEFHVAGKSFKYKVPVLVDLQKEWRSTDDEYFQNKYRKFIK